MGKCFYAQISKSDFLRKGIESMEKYKSYDVEAKKVKCGLDFPTYEQQELDRYFRQKELRDCKIDMHMDHNTHVIESIGVLYPGTIPEAEIDLAVSEYVELKTEC